MCVYVICAHNMHAWLYACEDTKCASILWAYYAGILTLCTRYVYIITYICMLNRYVYMHTLLISSTPLPKNNFKIVTKVCRQHCITKYIIILRIFIATSYGLEGKAVAFLWHAEILVAS